MTRTTSWIIGAAAIAAVVVPIWGICFRQTPPEVESIGRAISPDGARVAQVDMVVYGDHWFVNDPRYEVRIAPVNGRDAGLLVYSTMASGPSAPSVRWPGADVLEIQDWPEGLWSSVKALHPSVRINYSSWR